ncbi:MAG TPA: 2-oxoacid:acceptor oxidoreductase subunit alpha [Fibrobacteria bacterium]|nr:2-oxoacid:acceptor oxidoreductase subunit alpha [Fibrobacteria bacterium]
MSTDVTKIPINPSEKSHIDVDSVTIRFAGDSGDGMQVTGTQFTDASAVFGNDLATMPDFPAEIRAPAGTVAGVSAYQIHFSSNEIKTPGDDLNVLVAMNAAALKANIADLEEGGILLVDEAGFTDKDIEKAELKSNPLEDGSLDGYRVIKAKITELTINAVKETGLKGKGAELCKNFFTLGMMFWLYDRPMKHTLKWIEDKYGPKTKYKDKPEIAESNKKALMAGYNFADTVELFTSHYRVRKAQLPKGKYRKISGNEATVFGLLAASQKSGRPIFYGSYPITPASEILHGLSRHKNYGVITFQAEDEIAAIASALGASYAGALGVTATSGPGICLKLEAMGLGVMTELPLVIVDVQRGGPSTGLPTKTEQSDLLMAMFGRSGDSPVPVLAARSPSHCFDMAFEAARIATKYMTPVILLTDGYIANGSEPWLVPEASAIPSIEIDLAKEGEPFRPYERNPFTQARKWALPGTKGLEHRIGGLEKAPNTGAVAYDPESHQEMTNQRHAKIAGIANDIPPAEVCGAKDGEALVISWGGTYGAVSTAVEEAGKSGLKIAHVHLTHLNPFPNNLGEILQGFDRIIVPELNMGQLRLLLSGTFGIQVQGISQVRGKPFKVSVLVSEFHRILETQK